MEIRFTGKEEDVEVGLAYFDKRFLSPQLGRWMSADPLAVQVPGMDANPYAYVHGRLLKAVDVNGLWSSLDTAASQGVHQLAIRNVLAGKVDSHALFILQRQQQVIDRRQSAADQPLHAMRGTVGHEMPVREAVAKAEAFIRSEVTAARDAAAQAKALQVQQEADPGMSALREFSPEWQALEKQRLAQSEAAMEHLGNAIHVLQDATSPTHRGFQAYDDSPSGKIAHATPERNYPAAGTTDRARLEGATRWGYEMFVSGKMPEHMFDQDTGRVLIPEAYVSDPRGGQAAQSTEPSAPDQQATAPQEKSQ